MLRYDWKTLSDCRFALRLVSAQAYAECERITGIFAKTFYLGTKFMSPVGRKVSFYGACMRRQPLPGRFLWQSRMATRRGEIA